MYTAFYGLREKPFVLSPDPRFLYLSQSHREALAHLLYGIDQGEGFIAVTGEVGTGKTTLCRTLLERLGSETEVAFLFNPARSPLELLQAISVEFGLETEGRTHRELGEQLNRFLLDRRREKRRVLVIIDEAQTLTAATLEELRLLSNLETETSKLIQILLLGQPELDDKLESNELRQLRQRIAVRWRLSPLTASETREYVRHRLRIAAGGERPLFAERALREIHRRSRGVPRVVNVLCDRALLAGYAARAREVTASIVSSVEREVLAAHGAMRVLRRSRWLAAGAAAVLAALVASGLTWWQGAGERSDAAGAVSAPGEQNSLAPSAAGALRDPAAAAALAGKAEPVVPDAAPAEASPPVEDRAAFLGDLFARHPREVTNPWAVAAMLSAFGLGTAAESPASRADVPGALDVLRARGLTVLALPQATLGDLRVFNHPALLNVTASDGTRRLVGLRALDDEATSLFVAYAGESLELPISELENRWQGEAYVVWRDFEALPAILSLGGRGPAVAWLQRALAELGHYQRAPSGDFDAATREAVIVFQSRHRLVPDGSVGPRTKMVLYDTLGRYGVPQLVRSKDIG